MDVTYITVKANKLATIPIVDGQIITLSDKDALFYDMEGTRRPVSGQKIVSTLPTDPDEIYPDSLYIALGGPDQGIHIWNNNQFTKVASVNVDENVRSIPSHIGFSYLVGSTNGLDSTGMLFKHPMIYIDHATGKIAAQGFIGVADSAHSASLAEQAGRANQDKRHQEIDETYIKSLKAQGTQVTVTYGDETTKIFNTQDTDTHHTTNVVVTNSSKSQANKVSANGEVHLNISDDNQLRSSHVIKGEGSVEVTSDASGNIAIKGTDTWRPNTINQSGYVAPGEPDSVWSTDGDGNPSWRKNQSGYDHPDSGVTSGTYTKVTVNAQGHVTSGSNPDTLEGYNIKNGMCYKVLENDIDLNNYWTVPGFYVGLTGNSIRNKPEGVDGFGVIVFPDNTADYGVQKLIDWKTGAQFTRHIQENTIGSWSLDHLTDTLYKHPTGPGFNHIPIGGQYGQFLMWNENGDAVWATPEQMLVDVMVGSTQDNDGKSGVVPVPPAGPPEAFLRNDGSWSIPPNTVYTEMVGSTEGSKGQSGLVPAPPESSSALFLGSDGQWHAIDLSSIKPKWKEYVPE